jgi:putative transcriptional regulator
MSTTFRVKNNIRKLRVSANEMTQRELAEEAGISRQTVIALEAEKYLPTLELAFRIAQVFNVSIGEVFEYTHNTIAIGRSAAV